MELRGQAVSNEVWKETGVWVKCGEGQSREYRCVGEVW